VSRLLGGVTCRRLLLLPHVALDLVTGPTTDTCSDCSPDRAAKHGANNPADGPTNSCSDDLRLFVRLVCHSHHLLLKVRPIIAGHLLQHAGAVLVHPEWRSSCRASRRRSGVGDGCQELAWRLHRQARPMQPGQVRVSRHENVDIGRLREHDEEVVVRVGSERLGQG